MEGFCGLSKPRQPALSTRAFTVPAGQQRAQEGSHNPGRPSAITAVCVFLLFLMSTSVPGAGRGLATWSQGTGYTSAIAISLGDRKYFPRSMDEEIEAKGEPSKAFQGGEEPRALRLEACS